MDGELVKGCCVCVCVCVCLSLSLSLCIALSLSLSLLSKKAKACFHTCGNSCYCSFSLVINKGSPKRIENISSSFLLHFLFLFFFSSKKFLLDSLQGDVWLAVFVPPREKKKGPCLSFQALSLVCSFEGLLLWSFFFFNLVGECVFENSKPFFKMIPQFWDFLNIWNLWFVKPF
jgi:hypothetical protein